MAMLDIKFVRTNPEKVIGAMKTRGMDLDLSEFLALDEKRRELMAKKIKDYYYGL